MMKLVTILIQLALFIFSAKVLAEEAKIILLKGEVTSSGKRLSKNDWIKEGQEVVAVGKKSFAQLKFKSGSTVLIKDGKIILKVMKSKQNLVYLIKGTLFANKESDAKNKFNVKTKSASMAVRGTKFYLFEDAKTYLCVCSGTVAIKNKNKVNIKKKGDAIEGEIVDKKKDEL